MKLSEFSQLKNIHVTITQTSSQKLTSYILRTVLPISPRITLSFVLIAFIYLFWTLYKQNHMVCIFCVSFCSISSFWAPSRLWSMVVGCSSSSLYHILCVNISKFNHSYDHWWSFGHFWFFPIISCGAMNFLCMSFDEHRYMFLLNLHLHIGLLGQRTCIYSALGHITQQWFYKFILPPASFESSCYFLILPKHHIISFSW